jgi:dienelactone hydrolase
VRAGLDRPSVNRPRRPRLVPAYRDPSHYRGAPARGSEESGMTRALLLLALACAAAPRAGAQEPRFVLPAAGDVAVTTDVRYGSADTFALRMDVYRPAGATAARRPALVFFNRAVGAEQRNSFNGFYPSWARAAASRGLVAIVPDLRGGNEARDFRSLVEYLVQNAARLGIDGDALAVYAGSGNVYAALPIVQDGGVPAVRAAVMYYGTGPVTRFRLDLPLLWVRAGLDRPSVNQEIGRLAALAASQNAPVTLLNHATGYHAFEAFNDDDVTRDVIERTIDFVKRATAPSFQAALRAGLREATAAGHVQSGEFGEAATVYAELVRARPDDARLRLSYGEALLGAGRYADACAELETLKGKGLGPRDLGLPAARACMQKGDAEAAVAWLRTIPSRFLPADVQTDPVFAPLRQRADFRALFERR